MKIVGRLAEQAALKEYALSGSPEGNLFAILKSTIEQLNSKFLVRSITYEGIKRVEKN